MLHVQTFGEGIPIIFIHPPLLTNANFRYQQIDLSDDYWIITFDIRGHGKSAHSDASITYTLIVEDIHQLMDKLDIKRAFVCGYSTGGSVALEALLTHPNRFYGGILISAMSEATDVKLRSRIRLAIGLSRWQPLLHLLRWAISWGNADSKLTFKQLLRQAKQGHRDNIHQYYQCSLNYNCTEQLRHITAPILLLYGEKDTDFSSYRHKLQQGLPNCKLVIFQEEQHQLPTKAAGEVNKTIRKWVEQVIRS
ncbi:alpha/beta fold hydrolase [Paenibacillus taiwanensis]|uniref:alpha/beta fold hydrolase n=1 Tax=Paenibacillus taiwanensis TaxID=401638 RepID=UPI00041A9677|nr:alpha/beta hydrolase [Paenibacillus taiwanensis]